MATPSCRRLAIIRTSPATWTTSTSICVPAPTTPSGARGPPRRKTSRRPTPRRRIPAWEGNDLSEYAARGETQFPGSAFKANVESGMKTRAAVAFEAKKLLEIVEVDLDGPKGGEVLVEIKATGICHTDAYTLDGFDSEGIFPSILGHEGAGIVREVGAGVMSVNPGEHVIPLYTPECRQCKSCLSGKTNLCTAIRATQGKGVMPDGTSRFSFKGQPIYHYMGCSTFSNFTVLPEIAVAKIREDAPFDKSCYIGCGVTTGVGAVIKTAKVEPGANVVVFGLGGIGLNVIQGARLAGADKIIGVDINPARRAIAEAFGMTHFVNPKEV